MIITRITIETSLSPTEVTDRIRLLIGPNVDKGFLNGFYPSEKYPLHGKLKADGFCLRHIWAKAASPYVRGRIQSTPAGSRIDLRITPDPAIMTICSLQFLVILAVFVSPSFQGGRFLMLLFVASFALIGFLAYVHFAAKMEQLIRDALESQ